MSEVRIDVGATVNIEINDVDNVVTRYTDGRYPHPYGLTTEAEIYEHLAYNAVANGVDRANRLDGWADLTDDAATMHVQNVEADVSGAVKG